MTEQTTGTSATIWVEQPSQTHRPVIAAAKAAVPVIDLADLLCGSGKMRRVGGEWAGRCPLPDHEDRTPSFSVSVEKNLWFCHGCLRGGDVIDLAVRAWAIPRADLAAAELLMTFGHEVPQRSTSWQRKQQRQKSARDKLDAAKIEHVQRRIFRIFQRLLDDLEDEAEKREETERLWGAAGEIAALVWAGRRSA